MTHQDTVLAWLTAYLALPAITSIVSGGARGADTLAEHLARQLNKELVVFKPDYSRYGRIAPLIRNGEIAQTADLCVALLDKPLAASKGTSDCVKKFRRQGKPVFLLPLVETTGPRPLQVGARRSP